MVKIQKARVGVLWYVRVVWWCGVPAARWFPSRYLLTVCRCLTSAINRRTSSTAARGMEIVITTEPLEYIFFLPGFFLL